MIYIYFFLEDFLKSVRIENQDYINIVEVIFLVQDINIGDNNIAKTPPFLDIFIR